MKVKNKVQKMLSPEEATIISNIESLLQELMQMGAVEEPEVVMEAEDKPDVMTEDEDKNVDKALEETPSDAATASDDAEERMEEVLTEQTEENVAEVEKAANIILNALGKKNVNKSVKTEESPLTQVLNKIVEVQKSSQDQINDVSKALENVLEGLGIAKQLEVVSTQSREPQRINKSQNDQLIEALQSIVDVKKEEKTNIHKSQQSQVRKNLADANVLSGLIGR